MPKENKKLSLNFQKMDKLMETMIIAMFSARTAILMQNIVCCFIFQTGTLGSVMHTNGTEWLRILFVAHNDGTLSRHKHPYPDNNDTSYLKK
jgi:hypothetical protein